MIIDAHTHISYFPKLSITKSWLLDSMRKYKINYSIFSLDATEYQADNGRDSNKTIRKDIISLCKTAIKFKKLHNELFLLLWLKPSTTSIKEINELDKIISKNIKYIKGLKFHPYLSKTKPTDKIMKPYYDLANKYNLPILFHTAADEYSSISYLEEAAKQYPNIKFIAAHLELLSNNQSAIEVLKRNENIYGDTAWVDIKIINQLKKENLLDKIMFGTDNPIDGEDTLKNEMYQKYYKNVIKLSDEDYAKLMYKNANKIYDLKIKKI